MVEFLWTQHQQHLFGMRCISAARTDWHKQGKNPPPHTGAALHRRLQPLYTEKHKVSCSGFLPNRSPMQHSSSRYTVFCDTARTFMQPWQCDLHPRVAEDHARTDYASKQAHPHPHPHPGAALHRRLQPLYTEKHKVSCSGFLPNRSPMQHSSSRYTVFCDTARTFMQPWQCDLHPRVAEDHARTDYASKQAHPHPHPGAALHRRLQPLYTEKHKVSCSGFLPTTNPMQHSCSHYATFCSPTRAHSCSHYNAVCNRTQTVWCIVMWWTVVWCVVMCCIVVWCIVCVCDVLSCYVMSCDALSCDVLWCDVLSCDVCLCDVLWCDVLFCDVLLLHYTSSVTRKIAPQLPLIKFQKHRVKHRETSQDSHWILWLWQPLGVNWAPQLLVLPAPWPSSDHSWNVSTNYVHKFKHLVSHQIMSAGSYTCIWLKIYNVKLSQVADERGEVDPTSFSIPWP